MLRRFAWIASLGLAATAAAGPAGPKVIGPVETSIVRGARDLGVPAELAIAIAVEEGGVYLAGKRVIEADDHVPVAGAFELRHGRLDTLALGARLMNTTEDALREDTALGTRAGLKVLAKLGRDTGAGPTLASWRRALELLSGMDDVNAQAYASRVLSHVRDGGVFAAYGGEQIVLDPHPDISLLDTAGAQTLTIAATAPEYPGAMWFTTSCANTKCSPGRPGDHASVNKIVIHDTEGGWDASVATLQYDGGKSVHYIIDADGSRVGQFRVENDTTYHAGNLFYNQTSIGIEHVGTAANPAGYSPELYAKSVDLVQNIRTRWTVPLDRAHIIGHYQVPDVNVISSQSAPCSDKLTVCETSTKYGGADNHHDPGLHWQWCQYMESLGGSCTCNDAYDHWNCTTDKTEAVRCNNGTVEIEQCATPCEVQPSGVDDTCVTSAPPPDPGPDGSGSGSDTGSDSHPDNGATFGGCNTGAPTGSAVGLVLAFAAFGRRRRRR